MGELLEHFTEEDGRALLGECWRVLKPEGIIRIRVPDNARFWSNYLAEYEQIRTNPRQEWNSTHNRWVRMFFRDICVRRTLLGSYGHFHKFMYDEVTLTLLLEEVGFVGVNRQQLHVSHIEDAASVESHEDLTMEAVKPE